MNNRQELKIAMLGHKRIPSREGGIEIVVEELAERMVKLGNDVTCYNRRGHHVSGKEYDTEQIEEFNGISIKSVFTINKKGLAAMTSSASAALCAALGPYDIIHFHAEGPCAMLWLPKLFGKHCIVTVHGLDHQRAKWGKFARTYIMAGERCAIKHADRVIVLSHDMQNYFRYIYGRETDYIPNGVNRPIIRKADLISQRYGLEKDSYILFLGRIVPEKGLRYLIEAFQKVKTDKKLVIAGGASDTDEYLNELKGIAAEDKRIIFTGFVRGLLLDELYSNAYLYTLPSDLEGMPLSLLEAMSYGNCCVVSDIPECAEVVRDKAILFRKSDTEDLHDKLQKACEDTETVNKLKAQAADYICNKYRWEDTVNRTLSIYKQCIPEPEDAIAGYLVPNANPIQLRQQAGNMRA